MTHRIAASLALIAFALCLIVGGVQAGNPFTTTVMRALVALAGTYALGLLLGGVGQRMIEENLKSEEEKLRKNSGKPGGEDR